MHITLALTHTHRQGLGSVAQVPRCACAREVGWLCRIIAEGLQPGVVDLSLSYLLALLLDYGGQNLHLPSKRFDLNMRQKV